MALTLTAVLVGWRAGELPAANEISGQKQIMLKIISISGQAVGHIKGAEWEEPGQRMPVTMHTYCGILFAFFASLSLLFFLFYC